MKYPVFCLPFALLLWCSCHQTAPVRSVDWTGYRKAYAWLSKNRDSAFFYLNQVTADPRDSLPVAMAYSDMAMIQSDAGDYYGAQESLSLSLKFLDTLDQKNYVCLANDYNELGMTSVNLKHDELPLNFYDQALKYTIDPKFKPAILNNKAFAYQQRKDYRPALKLYGKLLRQPGTTGTSYARRLTNLATTKWLADPSYRAAPELLKALHIRSQAGDLWGQNSSYAHLADYYQPSKPDSARYYAGKMLGVAQGLNSPDDQLEALQKLIPLSSARQSKAYFARYLQLSDSLGTARNAAKNQFALIRYNVEKSKSDNLKLQTDNSEKKYQLAKQQVMLYAALFMLIAGTVAAVFWYRKRKRRLDREARDAIRQNQLRTSKKVHDVVANGLYRIMTELEHQSEINKVRLADRIETLYEQSRDISYEQEETPRPPFNQRIAGLVTAFATDKVKVALVGNSRELWEMVTPEAQYEMENILQELMVNMKKHSRASSVAIRFEKEGPLLHSYYTDNGIGMSAEVSYGNGLTNTVSRIAGLKGTLTFDTSVKQGLKIHLALPVF